MTSPFLGWLLMWLAESVNGETTPPKKKYGKRDKDDNDEPTGTTKKEKKKKSKPTVAKPKRTTPMQTSQTKV
jgi:hypothetical protein